MVGQRFGTSTPLVQPIMKCLHAPIVYPLGKFNKTSWGILLMPEGESNKRMLTSSEIRRQRLLQLIADHADQPSGRNGMSNLCEKLGYARTEAAKLSRIANANIRRDRGEDKVYNMGDAQARGIEEKLGLERGWMDTAPGLLDVPDETSRMALAMLAKLSPDEKAKALRLLGALIEPAQPPQPNGTHG